MVKQTEENNQTPMAINEKILAIAKNLIQKPLCNHCLGRQFARLGYNLTNEKRGIAIKIVLTMESELNKNAELLQKLAMTSEFTREITEKQTCYICNNLFDETEKFSNLAIKKMNDYEFSTFLIGSRVDGEIVKREEDLWQEFNLTEFAEPIRMEVNSEVGKLVEKKINKRVDFENPDIKAIIDTRYDNVEIQITPLFIYGRYRKLIRGLPQARWICKRCRGKGCEKCNFTGKIYPTSVQEIIAEKLIQKAKGTNHYFHGLGREDVDARMLGNGRPFILEIREPKIRSLNLQELEKEINEFGKEKVEVLDLSFSTHKNVSFLKEEEVNKIYRVLVAFENEKKLDKVEDEKKDEEDITSSKEKLKENENKEKIEENKIEEKREIKVEVKNQNEHRKKTKITIEKLKQLEEFFKNKIINQRTPERVAHRRADLIRERKVLEFKVEEFESNKAIFIIKGQGGLYIKELIHGDNGRTVPSVAEILGVRCVVKELDVIEVEG